MTVLGLDIGGANIKASTSDGRTRSIPFPLWKQPERLADELTALIHEFADSSRIAVTMTGELADCFATKSEGVRHIAESVRQAAGSRLVLFWTTLGRFVKFADVPLHPPEIAAANWHALARWAAGDIEAHPALLLDIGTTTTDIIPLCSSGSDAMGRTDRERLLWRELVYTGVRRTPVCALAKTAPGDEGQIGLAAELFATTLDVYLLLDDIAEKIADTDTANGRPATKGMAYDRLARMVCGDRDEVTFQQALQLARFLATVQQQDIAGAVQAVLARRSRVQTVVVSGSGEFLARRVVRSLPELAGANVISLSEKLGPGAATAACAHAVAQLAEGWRD